ncbi:MAG: hypothetical protein HN348_23855, partial [Proteobacteria bacterium]|nr:hypothetical protein [Pseudomonadota bacterium]
MMVFSRHKGLNTIYWLAIVVFLATPALGQVPWAELPEDPSVAWAQISQEILPQLEARRQTAAERRQARKKYFSGQVKFEVAFPHLVGTRLHSCQVLQGRLLALDEAAEQRMRERQAYPPDLPLSRGSRLADAIHGAIEAEDGADNLERRYLLGIRALVDDYPALEEGQLAALRAPQLALLAQEPPVDADDATKAAAARASAEADNELRHLDSLLERLRYRATVEAAAPLEASAEMALFEQQPQSGPAKRLELMLPFVTTKERIEIEAALTTWIVKYLLPEQVGRQEELRSSTDGIVTALPELEAAAEAAEAHLQVAVAAREGISGGEVGTLSEARMLLASAEEETATLARDRAAARLESARQRELGEVDAEVEATKAKQEAAQTRKAADEARAEAEARVASILDGLADSQERKTAAWSAVGEAKTRLEDKIAPFRVELQRLLLTTEELNQRVPAIRRVSDDDYSAVRQLVFSLRHEANVVAEERQQSIADMRPVEELTTSQQAEVRRERSLLSSIQERREQTSNDIDQWEQSLNDELEAAKSRIAVATDAEWELRSMLREASGVRRAFRPYASFEQARADRAVLLEDLGGELSHLGPEFANFQQERWHSLREQVGNVNLLGSLLFSSVWVLVVIAVWWLTRTNADSLVRGVLVQLRRTGARLRPVSLQALQQPTRKLLVALTDLVMGFLLLRVVAEAAPLIGLLLLAYLQVALYRFLMAAFDLAFEPHPPRRPALRIFRA